MLKLSQIQTFTQKSDFVQITFALKVWIQTFAKNSDQSGRPAFAGKFLSLQVSNFFAPPGATVPVRLWKF